MHWARDGAEANSIVAGIAQRHGAGEVIKVKSLASDEIGLNEGLAERGIAAIETDLAELIVQLGDDKPSHILVPAIHRNRAEIREIFLREMAKVGLPAPPDLTDEPRALAEAARLHLRRKFLEAEVAVSGANFAVAETGTLAVVESEGNGRMCLTLPRVLITVMGIEKLVPTWRDLEVFLQLLPRSSTGERMNPYTSMWTGVHPGDGLLDNGRTATLADPQGRSALRCIRCSACLNVCPVYERTGGHAYGSVYPGPIGAVLSPQLTGVGDNASLPYASTLCGACYDVCPVAIDIPQMLVHLRSRVVEAKREHSRVPSPEQVVMASAAWTMDSPARWANALRARQIHVVLQTTLEPHPELKGVPLAVNYAKTEESKKLLQIASELYGKQRLYSLPPQVPEERVRILQKAFIDTLKDPQLKAEAEKAKLEIDPIDGPGIEKMVKGLYEIEPAILKRVKQILESK